MSPSGGWQRLSIPFDYELKNFDAFYEKMNNSQYWKDSLKVDKFERPTSADYMLKVGVSNFRNAWESMDPESERVDEYGLGARESLAEAVSAVIGILGMQPCEGTDVVPSNSRSHTCLLSGVFIGNVKVLVRLSFGLSGPKEVAMKLAVRSDDPEISDKIHEIVANG